MRTLRFLAYLIAAACFIAAAMYVKRDAVRSAQFLAAGLAVIAAYETIAAAHALD